MVFSSSRMSSWPAAAGPGCPSGPSSKTVGLEAPALLCSVADAAEWVTRQASTRGAGEVSRVHGANGGAMRACHASLAATLGGLLALPMAGFPAAYTRTWRGRASRMGISIP